MGKKSKRQRTRTANSGLGRREAIQARRQQHVQPEAPPDIQQFVGSDPRTKLDLYRAGYLRHSTLNDSSYRHSKDNLLLNFQALMTEELGKSNYNAINFACKEDYSFLKRIYKNAAEDPLLRAKALVLFSVMKNCSGLEVDGTPYMISVKICNEAIASGDTRPGLFELRDKSLAFIDKCNGYGTQFKTNPDGSNWRVKAFAGIQCDSCGKLVQEFGVDFMAGCGRCKLTYYCSVDCQKRDWKEGRHRLHCRKRAQFEVGDTAVSMDESGPIGFATRVQLLVPIKCDDKKGKAEKWLVRSLLRDEVWVVLAQVLRRVRPIRWCSETTVTGRREISASILCRGQSASKSSPQICEGRRSGS